MVSTGIKNRALSIEHLAIFFIHKSKSKRFNGLCLKL
jgi:hypothetical protein